MNFEDIISIAGHGQLFKISAKTKFGLVAENLVTGKKIPVYNHYNVSTLEDISIYTEEKEMSLKDVLERIYKLENGESIQVNLKDAKQLKAYFEKVLQNYDKDRVFVSDIKKVIKWYNQLSEAKLLDFTDKKSKKQTTEKTKEKASASQKTSSKKNTSSKPKATTSAKQRQPNKAKEKPAKTK